MSIPVNTALPTISGTAQVGQTLTASTGEWTNNPTSFAYQWWNDTKNIALAGCTGPTHLIHAAAIGFQLTCHVTAINASGASVAKAAAPTAVVTAAGACPYSGYPDGCAGAPAGTPQYPSLLNGYGPHRPPWNVAGADYHVGVPDGAVLTDWRTLSDPHLTVDTVQGLIRLNGDFDFENIDFTLGVGASVYNSAGGASNITINNCRFQYPAHKGNYMIADQNSADLIITNCEMDAANANFPSFISAAGHLTVKYTWFRHNVQHIVEWTSNAAGKNIVFQYNLIDDSNIACCNHCNYQQLSSNGATIASDTVSFNTTYQHSATGSEGFQFYFNGSGHLTNAILENNTMIAIPIVGKYDWKCPTNCVHGLIGPETMTYLVRGGPVTGVPGSNKNNYFDVSGALGAYAAGTMTPGQNWSSSGNIDMNTGATIVPA